MMRQEFSRLHLVEGTRRSCTGVQQSGKLVAPQIMATGSITVKIRHSLPFSMVLIQATKKQLAIIATSSCSD